MILKGNEDLRVVKTIGAIKDSFAALIREKEYERITVKELCERAKINKKTFYHYYETLDALLCEMQTELSAGFLERIQGFRLPEDLAEVNRAFFLYSEEQGPAYEKITCSGTYRAIRDKMISEVNDAGWRGSAPFRRLSGFERKLLMEFINNAVLGAYRQWVESGKALPLEEIVALTNLLVLGGVNGFFKERKA